MTKGSMQGHMGSENFGNQKNWLLGRRTKSRGQSCRHSSYALTVAVLAALYPSFSQAAEEVWPETIPLPTARPIQAAAPLAPDAPPVELVPAETYNSEEPMPPGEGPGNEIDTVTIGEGGGIENFWKPEIHAGVTESVVFDDNIFITNTAQVSDTIFVTSARATLAFGNVQQWASRFIDTTARALAADSEEGSDNLIALSYAPTYNYFLDNDNLNSVEHDVAGTVRWNFGKLKVAFDGRFQTLSDPDEDLGTRADRKITTSKIVLTYTLSDKTNLQLDGSVLNRNYDIGTDSTQFDGNAFVLYELLPKTTIGVGLGGGELELDGGGNQTFERALVRLKYDSYSKWVLNLTGGGELRQSDGQGEADQFNGVFQIGVSYTPTEGSQFSVSAFRGIEPSASRQSQSIERTSFSIAYNQRLLQKLSLSTNLSYSLADYTTPIGSIDSNRSDDIFSFSTTLTFEITQNGFVRLGYVYRQNDSSREVVSYESNQFIISATALF